MIRITHCLLIAWSDRLMVEPQSWEFLRCWNLWSWAGRIVRRRMPHVKTPVYAQTRTCNDIDEKECNMLDCSRLMRLAVHPAVCPLYMTVDHVALRAQDKEALFKVRWQTSSFNGASTDRLMNIVFAYVVLPQPALLLHQHRPPENK